MAGVLLLFGAVAPVLAFPTGVSAVLHQGDTEVEPSGGLVEGCEFHFHISALEPTTGDWAIRADEEHGTDVLTGSYDTAEGPDRVPGSGTLKLASGHYVLVWDNESPIDRSFGELPFDVACEQPVDSGGEEPIDSGGEEPIDSGGEEPINSGGEEPLNSGEELGIVGTPRLNLPSTDTNAISSTNSSDLRPALGLMGLLAIGSLFVASRRRRSGSRHS